MMYTSQFWKIDPYEVWKWERDIDIKNEEKLIVWGLSQDNWAL